MREDTQGGRSTGWKLEVGSWELEEGSRLWLDFRPGGSISLIFPWVGEVRGNGRAWICLKALLDIGSTGWKLEVGRRKSIMD
ncbi:MAG: hypothetical protein NXH89_02135 [Cyclobacteriaceae bacterium]|nr:hypothetical protein [Cyclobacteriaceae bacterium]